LSEFSRKKVSSSLFILFFATPDSGKKGGRYELGGDTLANWKNNLASDQVISGANLPAQECSRFFGGDLSAPRVLYQSFVYTKTFLARVGKIIPRSPDTESRIFEILSYAKSRGRCYDHQFSASFDNFRQKIGVFLKNQCYDEFLHHLAMLLSQKRQFLRRIFRRIYI
jgi:hypothetical protein